jgi:signal transduction histidine kinase
MIISSTLTFNSCLWLFVAVSFLFYLPHSAGAQHSTSDSLDALINQTPSQDKINLYQNVIIKLWRNDPGLALQYANDAIEHSKKLNDLHATAIATRLYGGTLYYLGSYDSALLYAKKAYKLSVASGDSALIASSLSNIGLDYVQMGSYPEALENLLLALSIKRKIKLNYALGITLNNIGLVYIKLKDYTKAREFLKEAMLVSEQLQDEDARLYASNNLGFSYLYDGNLNEAFDYFTQSLRISESRFNLSWRAVAYIGLGQTHLANQEPVLARQCYDQALTLYKEINDKVGIAEAYYLISRVHFQNNNMDSALQFINLSRHYGDATGSRERKLDAYKLLEDVYTHQHRYDSALFYKSRFMELRDSMFNESQSRTLANIEVRVSEEEAGQVLASKDSLIQKKTTQTYFLIALVLIIFFFSIILYWSYKAQARLSIDLQEKNIKIFNQKDEIQAQKEELQANQEKLEIAQKQIEEQNKELAKYNKQLIKTVDKRTRELELANEELKVANLELDNFIYKSSHDIKGPLVRLLGVCNVAMMDIKDEVSREYFTMFHQTAQHLNELFDRLKIVNDIGSVELARSPIQFNAIIDNAKNRLKHIDIFQNIEIQVTNLNTQEFISDPFLMETIFYNMLENAVRFQKKDSEGNFIQITIEDTKQHVRLRFVDNGIGIQADNLQHVFNMFSKAAQEHKTIGLGLYTVKQCVTKLNGSIVLNNNNQHFTEFEILLPFPFHTATSSTT